MSGKNREREMRLRVVSEDQAYDRFDGLHAIAKRECAKTGTVTSYPKNFIEFHDVEATSLQTRSALGLDLGAMRKILANGLPYNEVTDPDMGSVTEYDSSYKLDTPYARAVKAQAA